MKETLKHLNKWKNIPCSWIGGLNFVKLSITTKLIYRVNLIPNKILMSFLGKIYKINFKFTWKGKESSTTKTILKNNKASELTLGFKTLNKVTEISVDILARDFAKFTY